MHSTCPCQRVRMDWPPGVPASLRSFEEGLACPVCAATLTAPVAAPCGHTVCSHCMKQWTASSCSSNPLCPVCRAPAPTLVALKGLDALIYHYNAAKPFMVQAATALLSQSSKATPPGSLVSAPAVEEAGHPRNSAHFTSKKPVRAYAHFPEKLLKAELLSWGLPITGGTQKCIDRHKAYVSLWNSAMDSFAPPLPSAIVKTILKAETTKAGASLRAEVENTHTRSNFPLPPPLPSPLSSSLLPPPLSSALSIDLTADDEEIVSPVLRQPRPHREYPMNRPPRTRVSFEWKAHDSITTDMAVGWRNLADEIRQRRKNSKGENTLLPPSSQEVSSQPSEGRMGPWRIVYSAVMQRPFYFNEDTGVGQFEVPIVEQAVDVASSPILHPPAPALSSHKRARSTFEDSSRHEAPTHAVQAAAAAADGSWTCEVCTFINTKGARKCRVCSTKRNNESTVDASVLVGTRRGTRYAVDDTSTS
jgi:hypothetical protein